MGSFYNHFDSKEQLFEAAVADVLDALRCRCWTSSPSLASTTRRRPSPAASGLTGRLFRRRPQESQILLANGLALLSSRSGSGTARPARYQSRRVPPGRFDGRRSRTGPSHRPAARCSGLGNLLRDRSRSRRRARLRRRHRERSAAVRAQTPSRRTRSANARCPPSDSTRVSVRRHRPRMRRFAPRRQHRRPRRAWSTARVRSR